MHTAHWSTLIWFGIFSTVGMDVLLYLRHKLLRQPWFDYRVFGLALLKTTLPHGLKHTHANTTASLLGWGLHYVIGVLLAVCAVYLAALLGLNTLSLVFCLLYGMATVVLPFCSMQPLLGLGFAASKTAQPWRNRGKSVFTHALFGLSLYLTALCFWP